MRRVLGSRRTRLTVLALLAAAGVILTTLERGRMNASATGPALPGPPLVDAETLMRDLTALASPDLQGRETSSPGGLRARAYIVSRFREIGLQPVADTLEQPFSFVHYSIRGLLSPSRPYRREFADAANIVGRGECGDPAQPFLIVSAHYDHLGIREGDTYPGADDNASGVATLLAAAGYLSHQRPALCVVFAAFDGEEEGLQGSRYFAEHPPIDLSRVAAVVNLDMIARGDDGTIVVSGTRAHPDLKAAVLSAAAARSIRVVFGHDRPWYLAGAVENWTQSSDHGPFAERQIPWLYFGVEDHDDYHQPTDTVDRIYEPFFVEAANLVAATTATLAGADQRN